MPLLAARQVSKQFSGVPVLRDVDLDVRAGEVHALLGENGAGKSTLMHIIAGVFRRTPAICVPRGTRSGSAITGEAQRAGVAMVFQERSLAAPLTVAENVFFGRQPAPVRASSTARTLRRRTRRMLLDELGVRIDPDDGRGRISRRRSSRWWRSPRRCRWMPGSSSSTSPPPR